MNIIAISDLHGYLPKDVGSGDVLVVAGDLCPDFADVRLDIGSAGAIEKQIRWMNTQYADWAEEQSKKFEYVISIPGNHDFIRDQPLLTRAIDDLYLEPQVVGIEKYLFYVSPFCLKLPGWSYSLTEDELWSHYKNIPIGVDVIVSHGPAADYLDRCEDGRRVGSRALKNAIKRSRPSVVVCGHIHEAYGKYELGHDGTSHKTRIFNVSQRTLYYECRDRPVSIQLQERAGFTE